MLDLSQYGKEDLILICDGYELMQNSKSKFFLEGVITLLKKDKFERELKIMPFMVKPVKINHKTKSIVEWGKIEGFSLWIKLK